MLLKPIIAVTRKRWQGERPFEGHAKESLKRKLVSPAVREDVKEIVR